MTPLRSITVNWSFLLFYTYSIPSQMYVKSRVTTAIAHELSLDSALIPSRSPMMN